MADNIVGELYQIKIDNKIYGVQDKTARENLATEITNRTQAITGVQAQITGVQTKLLGEQTDTADANTINGLRKAINALQTKEGNDITGVQGQIQTGVQGVQTQLSGVQSALEAADAALLGTQADSPSTENSIWGLRKAITDLAGTDSSTLATIEKIKAELNNPSAEGGELNTFLDKVTALIAGFQTESGVQGYTTIKNYIDTQDAGVQSRLIGKQSDAATANTIHGVRKALADVQSALEAADTALLGTQDDTETDNTIYGLKAGVQGVKQTIENNEQVVAASLNDLEDRKANKQDVDTAISGVQSRIDTLDTANNNIQEKTLNYVTNVTYNNGVLEITTGTAKVLEYKTSPSNS